MMPLRSRSPLAQAAMLLRTGNPVLVFDGEGREREVDLFFDASGATPETVLRLRTEAGGLPFLAVPSEVATRFGLPLLDELHQSARDRFPVLSRLSADSLPYDKRSSFSLTLNHRSTFTGITDRDRAKTIRRFAELAQAAVSGKAGPRELGDEFRSPGHVHLCVAAQRLLEERRGHTELAVALARLSGAGPVLAGAEMLAPGGALPLSEARTYAEHHGTVLLTATEILAAWRTFKGPVAV